MNVLIIKASNDTWWDLLTFDTMEQLLELRKKYKHDLILKNALLYKKKIEQELKIDFKNIDAVIQIYDDYME